jgi:hypothetical protein
MTLLKICSLILFYFITRVALAAPCENFEGYKLKEKLCWNDKIKGWMSERCKNQDNKCEARDFFQQKKKISKVPDSINGQNPAALYCHHLKLGVVVLKDAHKNEQSFCQFKDQSLVDANAIERHVR